MLTSLIYLQLKVAQTKIEIQISSGSLIQNCTRALPKQYGLASFVSDLKTCSGR